MTNIPSTEQLHPGQKNGTGAVDALWQDRWTGTIWTALRDTSKFTPFFPLQTLTGTNQLSDKYMGNLTVKKHTLGNAFDNQVTDFDKKILTVETPVESRGTINMLDWVQNDFDLASKIGQGQGEEFADFLDQAFAIAGLKAALEADRTQPARKGGTKITAATSGDYADPEKFLKGIRSLVTDMKEKKAFKQGAMKLFMSPTQAAILRDSDKLINTDYSSGNGNYAAAVLRGVEGVEVVETTAIPTDAITNHPLSTANNSNFFNVTAEQAKVKALLLHPDCLMAAQAIPLQTKAWMNDDNKMHYMDAWMAFSIGTRDSAKAGVLMEK